MILRASCVLSGLTALACASPPDPSACQEGAKRCDGHKLMSCEQGRWLTLVNCAAVGGVCVTDEPEAACGAYSSACPYVDVQVDGRWVEAGEILRDLHRPSREGPQDLVLGRDILQDGVLRVRLAERKAEVTHLDGLWLEMDGRTFAPTLCPDSLLCEVDSRHLLLHEGEELELAFEVGDHPGQPVLWAFGYYVPLRAR